MKRCISVLCITLLLTAACQKIPIPVKAKLDLKNVSGEITVSCYNSMNYKIFLEEAAAKFQEKYEGTKINIETAAKIPEVTTPEENGIESAVMTNEEDVQGMTNYIGKISDELISGGGPDVIAADIIPYAKYGLGGQLDDLNTYIAKDNEFNYDGLLKNVPDAVQIDGAQYIMPIDYSFNYYAYDSDLFTESEQAKFNDEKPGTIESLVELSKAAFERNNTTTTYVPIFGLNDFGMKQSMFWILMHENYKALIDIDAKLANFNDGTFASLLETVKAYADAGYISRMAAEQGETPPLEEMNKTRLELQLLKQKDAAMMLQDFNKASNQTMFMARLGNDESDKVIGPAKDKNGEMPLAFTQAYGINANSENKALSWAFIKFLLSDEAQRIPSLKGFPLRTEARVEKSKAAMLALDESTELSEEKQKILDEYTKAFEEFSAGLNSFIVLDETLIQIINLEAKAFFEGTKTAKEVGDSLQDKIDLYLN